MSRLFTAKVVENRKLAENHFIITFEPDRPTRTPAPGTFFMVSVDSGLDPLLKRPFSLHRWLGGRFQLFYRVTGKGTAILSEKKPGSRLEVIGPLGNGFPRPKTGEKIILAAGGMGVAPIVALAESLQKKRPSLFYGTKTAGTAYLTDTLKTLGIDPVMATDDGSLGSKGTIVTVLKKHLRTTAATDHVVYACGPEVMLKSLSALTSRLGVRGYIAMEQNMACGIGTCLGCVVQTRSGYKRICKEGPVFPIEDIVW